MKKLLLLIGILLLIPLGTYSANRFWTTTSTQATLNWSSTTNWSGNAIPTVIDDVFFTASSTANSFYDISSTINSLTISSTYSGVITMATSTPLLPMIIGGGGFNQTSGTFTMNNGYLADGGVFSQTGGTFNASGTLILNATSSKSFTPSSSLANVSLNDGLVGYWKLDDPASLNNSSTTTDSSGYGNNGTVVNMGPGSGPSSTVSSTFQFSNPQSFNFDGTNDFVNVSDSIILTPPQITFLGWINTRNASSEQIIAQKCNGCAFPGGSGYFFEKTSTGKLFVEITNGALKTGNTVLASNQWYHVGFSYDSSTLSLYLNGVSDGTLSTSAGLTNAAVALTIGKDPSGVPFFNGLIDDVRIYNRALSASEITDLYNGTGPKVSSSTIQTLGGALTVAGNLTIAGGMLDVSSTQNYGITVNGNWLNYASSTNFISRNGTVTLGGANQSISGATNFTNLTKTVTASSSLTFDQKSLQTVSGTLTLQGASGQLLSLQSSSSSVQWKINPSGYIVSYLNVKDSNNINATAIACNTGCTNAGNDTNWTFSSPTSGGGSSGPVSGSGPSAPPNSGGTSYPPAPAPFTIPSFIRSLISLFVPQPTVPSPTITTSKKPPLVFRGEWDLILMQPIHKFVLEPLPSDLATLEKKFPQLTKLFKSTGIEKITDVGKLTGVELRLPTLGEAAEPNIVTVLPQSVPLAKMSPSLKRAIPTNVVFARTADETIDLTPFARVNNQGNTEQTLHLASRNTVKFIFKPSHPARSVKGYILFKEVLEAARATPENYLASLNDTLSPSPLFIQEFDYRDRNQDGIFDADVQLPAKEGLYQIKTVVAYQDAQLGMKESSLEAVIDPDGYVYQQVRDQELRIRNAHITLYWFNPESHAYEIWPAGNFRQQNPQITGVTGQYGFLVPDGKYLLKAEVSGYQSYRSEPFDIAGRNGINFKIELQKRQWWQWLFRR